MRLKRTLGIAAVAVAAVAAGLAPAGAHSIKKNGIEVVHPWTRETDQPATEVYFKIKNAGAKAERLVGASSPDAEKVELRQPSASDKDATTALDAVTVPAKGESELTSSTVRLVVTGLKKKLDAYGRMPLTLQFERAGKMAVEVMVEEAAESAH